MGLSWLNPIYLWLLAGVPLIYYLYVVSNRKKKRAAMKFSNLGLVIKASGGKKFSWRKHIEFILIVSALVFLIIALADPHIPLKRTQKGVNVVLAIDVSGSMNAKDYPPSRIEAAKIAAKTLIDSLKPKDNVGIVVFESGATTASFLTQDKDRARDKLSSIQAKQGMTAIGDGLSLAVDMVTSIPNKKKLVILLSDGVNNAGIISPDEAISFAKQNGIQVYTIGMGSSGKTVLGRDMFGNPIYAELDETLLKKIAQDTGGEYYRAVDDDTLNQIYKGLSNKIKREKESTSIKDVFIGLSIACLLALIYFLYGRFRVIR